MYFPDLATRSQIHSAPFVRAIGWLDAAHPFPTGPSPDAFRSRLRSFAARWGESTSALGWPAAAGCHECQLCGGARASGNFGVLAGASLYVCPEMVAHYVSAHVYLPPAAFIDAVMRCPMPWSARYLRDARRFRL